MARHVTGDLHQVGESVAGAGGWREAVRVFALMNDGCPLLFDAGSHIHRAPVMAALDTLLAGAAPGYVFLTHTELPHTGNLSAIMKRWPETKIVVSSGILPHVELPWWVREEQILYAAPGETIAYGGREIFFLDGILKDQPGTQWMYDAKTGALFTADAFGYFFPDDADNLFDDELPAGVPSDWLKRYHESAFRFLPQVSGEKVIADIRKVFEKRAVRVIAPTHGAATRADPRAALARFERAIREICR